jgi:hypothetical protein
MRPGAFDNLMRIAQNYSLQKVTAPDEVSSQYSDAELYRILVAQAMTDGAVATKAQFDGAVRTLGNVRDADELIAFRNLRPGCRAWRHGKTMTCECSVHWRIDDPAPPYCKEMPK